MEIQFYGDHCLRHPDLFYLRPHFSLQLFASLQFLVEVHRVDGGERCTSLASTSQACWHTCCLTSYKTNTFLVLDENKMRAGDESEKHLRVRMT